MQLFALIVCEKIMLTDLEAVGVVVVSREKDVSLDDSAVADLLQCSNRLCAAACCCEPVL